MLLIFVWILIILLRRNRRSKRQFSLLEICDALFYVLNQEILVSKRVLVTGISSRSGFVIFTGSSTVILSSVIVIILNSSISTRFVKLKPSSFLYPVFHYPWALFTWDRHEIRQRHIRIEIIWMLDETGRNRSVLVLANILRSCVSMSEHVMWGLYFC